MIDPRYKAEQVQLNNSMILLFSKENFRYLKDDIPALVVAVLLAAGVAYYNTLIPLALGHLTTALNSLNSFSHGSFFSIIRHPALQLLKYYCFHVSASFCRYCMVNCAVQLLLLTECLYDLQLQLKLWLDSVRFNCKPGRLCDIDFLSITLSRFMNEIPASTQYHFPLAMFKPLQWYQSLPIVCNSYNSKYFVQKSGLPQNSSMYTLTLVQKHQYTVVTAEYCTAYSM